MDVGIRPAFTKQKTSLFCVFFKYGIATLADDFMISTEQEVVNTNICSASSCTKDVQIVKTLQKAIFMMTSFYYFDQNPSEVCFLVQIRPFAIQTSLRLPNLNMKGNTKRILVVVVK